MAKQIISNKVYESLQVPTENTITTTGKVIYANPFSGISQVAMPEDIKELLDDDFGLVGNNVLIQLEQKFLSYKNGPWYIDSRDGVIYIHNRKFNEEPHHTYVYQNENGEVLSVSFETKEVTKKVNFQLSQTIDPENKDLVSGSSEIKDDFVVNWWSTPNTPWARGGNPFPVMLDVPWKPGPDMNQVMRDQVKKREEYERKQKVMKEFNPEDPYSDYRSSKENKLKSLSDKEYLEAIGVAVDRLPNNQKLAVERAIKEAERNGTDPSAALKKATNGSTYLFSESQSFEYFSEEWVDPREYDPLSNGVLTNRYTEVPGKIPTDVKASANRGIKALDSDPLIQVMPNTLTIDYTDAYSDANLGTKEILINSVKVKIRRFKKLRPLVPIYTLYTNLFNRYGGAKNYAKALQSAANGGLKRKERVLECNMTVVGRPSLESSQVLLLLNVGSKWSGPWYIKKCTHMMDAGNGYTCQLELVKNLALNGNTTAKINLNTQNMVANGAKQNAKTEKGKDLKNDNGKSEVTLNWTQEEVKYYGEKFNTRTYFGTDSEYINQEKPIARSVKGVNDALANKLAWDETYADDPTEKTLGTVVTTQTVTSSGGVINQKVEERKAPEKTISKYRDRFNDMDIAITIFNENIKNKK